MIKYLGAGLSFLTVLLFAGSAAAECNFRTSDHVEAMGDIAMVKRVEVEINKYKKWTINGLSILTDRSQNIRDNRKKNFKATVKVVYPFGSCEYKAKVRQNGDWKDHIVYNNNAIVQSLNVVLDEGNIAHFVRFKLLLPHTRESENEILFSTLLRDLGYLSPRSRLVDTVVNDVQYKMLLQESAAKEFLEEKNRREGPLFEGDEQLVWGWGGHDFFELEPVSLSKLINDKWAVGGNSSINMTQDAFFKLQKAYLRFSANAEEGIFLDWNLLTNQSKQAIDKWAVYEILVLAAGGSHALRPTNRQFFWNAFEQSFEPVYYDGNIKLSYDIGYGAKELQRYKNVLNPEHFAKARAALANIDIDRFTARINKIDTKFSSEQIAAIFATLSEGITSFEIAVQNAQKSDDDKQIDDLKAFGVRLEKMIPGALTGTLMNMDFEQSKAEIQFCVANTEDCKTEKMELTQFVDFMGGKYFINKLPAIITSGNESDLDELQNLSFKADKLKIRASKNADIRFSADDNQLVIRQTGPDDWVLIHDSIVDDISIVMIGLDASSASSSQDQRFNRFGLTGCLNFFHSKFVNSSVSAVDGICEDSVNIVDSDGSLKKLDIVRSFADAIDIDFSRIEIEKAVVSNAGNDCLDVSSGSYNVKHLVLNSCGDKGISVGEASKFTGETVELDGAEIGVSSKDSSNTFLKSLVASKTKICAEAFKKKQEFAGAKLEIGELVCPSDKFNFDINSEIKIGKAVR